MAARNSVSAKVSEFLQLVGKRRLWIQTHDIPDPDAIASAEAFRLIARHFGISARIVINGFPNRRENNVLIKECKIHMHNLDSVNIRSAASSAWVYIDCLPGGGNVTLHPRAPGDLFLAIDHHMKSDTALKSSPKAFIINDQTVGATATLLGRLLLDLDVAYPPRLASALTYAIITDTQDFSRGATKADLDIYTALFPMTNLKIISRLRNVTKPRDYFRIVHASLENAFYYRHVAWAFIGEVATGESVAEMADLILSCERITWALALGYSPKRLYLSLRSSQPKARCARVIRRLVQGLHSTVGGHNEFAGGFVFLDSESDPVSIAETIIKHFERLILRMPKSAEPPPGSPLVE